MTFCALANFPTLSIGAYSRNGRRNLGIWTFPMEKFWHHVLRETRHVFRTTSLIHEGAIRVQEV